MAIPTKKRILAYWQKHAHLYGFQDRVADEDTCFACASETLIERAHIIARSVGGSDDPSNIVLLCYRCHRFEAPDTNEPEDMFGFIRSQTTWVDRMMGSLANAMKNPEFATVAHYDHDKQLDFLKWMKQEVEVNPGIIFPHRGIASFDGYTQGLIRLASKYNRQR